MDGREVVKACANGLTGFDWGLTLTIIIGILTLTGVLDVLRFWARWRSQKLALVKFAVVLLTIKNSAQRSAFAGWFSLFLSCPKIKHIFS